MSYAGKLQDALSTTEWKLLSCVLAACLGNIHHVGRGMKSCQNSTHPNNAQVRSRSSGRLPSCSHDYLMQPSDLLQTPTTMRCLHNLAVKHRGPRRPRNHPPSNKDTLLKRRYSVEIQHNTMGRKRESVVSMGRRELHWMSIKPSDL